MHYGVHFLEKPEAYRDQLGKSMIIIGAGNVAMDVARTALRMGVKDVKITVRTDNYSASKEEKEYAEYEGAEFVYNKQPVEITDEGVMFVDTVCDENHKIVSTGDTPALMKADSVMICISQRPSNMILTQTKGLETNERGLAKIAENGETTREGVFASGDVVKGAKTVVEAAEQSKRVAYAMHEYLQSLNK